MGDSLENQAPGGGMQAAAKLCPKCGTRYDAAATFCQQDAQALVSADVPDPYIGQLLFGQFRIDEVIGAGGMGTVYRARQLPLDRDVAVKILHRELVQNPDAVRRFHREARVTTSLSHPNLVHVYLFGQLPDGSLYLVMEFLNGESLVDVLRREGALSLPRALSIAVQLCDGVGEAHAHGVVHRDVKPENVILLAQSGAADFVKVLDFGIARFMWGEQTLVTQSGLIFGTARYISPEGAAGEPTDARSDVYSIATLLYQLCCGETPFDSPSLVAVLMKHMNEPAPDIRGRARGMYVPPPVADVIMQCLSKNPEGRHEDARALGSALRQAAQLAGVYVPPPLGGMHARAPSVSHAGLATDPGRVFASRTPSTFPSGTVADIPGLSAPRMGAFATILVAFALGAAAVTMGAFFMTSLLRKPASEEPAQAEPAAPPRDHEPKQQPPTAQPQITFAASVRTNPAEPRAGQPTEIVAEITPADALPADARVRFRIERSDGSVEPALDARRGNGRGVYVARKTFARAGSFRVVLDATIGNAAPLKRDLPLIVRAETRRRPPMIPVTGGAPSEENHDIAPLAPIAPPSPVVEQPSSQDGIDWQLPETPAAPNADPEAPPSATDSPAPSNPPASTDPPAPSNPSGSTEPPAPWTQGDGWM